MPVFQVVNQSSKQYLFFPDPILNIFDHINELVLVKRMNNENENKSGYYLGEIAGRLTESENNKKKYYILNLYFSTAYQELTLDEETDTFTNLIDHHEYIFPKGEFKRFMMTLDAMYEQQGKFQTLLRHSTIL